MDGEMTKRIEKLMFKWVINEQYKEGAPVVPLRLSAGVEVVYGPGNVEEGRQVFWSPGGFTIMFAIPRTTETSCRRSALVALKKHLEPFGVDTSRLFEMAKASPPTEAELRGEDQDEQDGDGEEEGAAGV